VDGAKSEDEVYGFGPRGGYVFQKPFVELFVSESVATDLAERAKAEDGLVTFYAGNKKVCPAKFPTFRTSELRLTLDTIELLRVTGRPIWPQTMSTR
jgi:hypothetical protein